MFSLSTGIHAVSLSTGIQCKGIKSDVCYQERLMFSVSTGV